MKDKLAASDTDIAVIGMACRFPGAGNYTQFWNNLVHAVCSIREIPPERWDWRRYWGDPDKETNKSNSRWGGFINEVDCFDARFFKLSPAEVMHMDPQQRIMLELSWACLEDAGICPSSIRGSNTGVFTGVYDFDFKEVRESNPDKVIDAHHATGATSPIVTNRVSYLFNFTGPSLPVNAACSASLHAVHLAIQSIQLGECDMALAGGVGLLLTPTKFIAFGKAGMLSATNTCRPFDSLADGFIRGEGAGVVLLKPLQRALADGDYIHAVIRGSAVNHGGKSYSLTYPSADSQAAVISNAIRKAGIPVASISYVEAHATGTPKGDPIEYAGLVKAFREMADEPLPANSCALGTAKANIGHLESAAGIAGLIKAIMMLKNKTLTALPNFRLYNPAIQTDNSPFYIPVRNEAWVPPADPLGQYFPRRAGVSSFGFGGTNSHVILEEAPPLPPPVIPAGSMHLTCLSAQQPQLLLQRIYELYRWLEEDTDGITIADITLTLATGREHYEYRAAFVTADLPQLISELKKFHTTTPAAEISKISGDLQQAAPVTDIPDEALLHAMAAAYISGQLPDWNMLYRNSSGKRVPLPSYPFRKDSFPIYTSTEAMTSNISQTSAHGLIQQTHATFSDRLYSSVFDGTEFFLRDHQINGHPVFPGVLYLETVREAIALALDRPGYYAMQFRNIVWVSPFIFNAGQQELYLQLTGTVNNVQFSCYAGHPEQNQLVAQGEVTIGTTVAGGATEDTEDITYTHKISREEWYARMQQQGYNYGALYQCVETLHTTTDKVIAIITIPDAVVAEASRFRLHPGVLDAALQAAIALFTDKEEHHAQLLPFALESMQVYDTRIPHRAVAHKHPDTDAASGKYYADIDLIDKNGNYCIRFKGFTARKAAAVKVPSPMPEPAGVLLFQPVWHSLPPAAGITATYTRERIVLTDGIPTPYRQPEIVPGREVEIISAGLADSAAHFTTCASRLLEILQALAAEKSSGKTLLQVVIPIDGENQLLWGLSGMLDTARAEYPWLVTQLIGITDSPGNQPLTSSLDLLRTTGIAGVIRITGQQLHLRTWEELPATPADQQPWKPRGVYLITGGAGGIGRLLARDILTTPDTIVVLAGRSPENTGIQKILQHLRRDASRIYYRQTDTGNYSQVQALAEWIGAAFGRLDGIIHAAGITHDNYLLKKNTEELVQVFSPKVHGLVNLDKATAHFQPDFLLLFASISGALGNVGQADYAAANAFMDAFAAYRNSLTAAGKRSGKTIAADWPQWTDGSLKIPDEEQSMLAAKSGISKLDTTTALQTLYTLPLITSGQVLVLSGEKEKIRQYILSGSLSPMDTATPDTITAPVQNHTFQVTAATENQPPPRELLGILLEKAAQLLHIPEEELDADSTLDDYGFDSILYTRYASALNTTLHEDLTPPVILEYNTINRLAGYLTDKKNNQ
ncbi:SDR family NAD(P)-dependent oxidoreductase [Chitinophaga sp. Mgbs1]|uniref:SDR family NAD(P)-dependent oxidoreductase n=1 Tax=Chitinophaga solisilvae TaxID=1233460 RepID=A0A433WMX8_9BACT|nr:SDR family NAD(P)-dependent oxidoreductase [Chitinophaga solisilvae]